MAVFNLARVWLSWGEDRRNVVDDRRPLGGVVDLEVADHLDEHLQFARAPIDPALELPGLGHGREALDLVAVLDDRPFVGGQRLWDSAGIPRKSWATFRPCSVDFGLQRVDLGRVDVAQLANRR